MAFNRGSGPRCRRLLIPIVSPWPRDDTSLCDFAPTCGRRPPPPRPRSKSGGGDLPPRSPIWPAIHRCSQRLWNRCEPLRPVSTVAPGGLLAPQRHARRACERLPRGLGARLAQLAASSAKPPARSDPDCCRRSPTRRERLDFAVEGREMLTDRPFGAAMPGHRPRGSDPRFRGALGGGPPRADLPRRPVDASVGAAAGATNVGHKTRPSIRKCGERRGRGGAFARTIRPGSKVGRNRQGRCSR